MLLEGNNSILQDAIQRLAVSNIELRVTKKRVKNVNFRLKPYQLIVSVPIYINDTQMAQAIDRRIDWALAHHQQVINQHQCKQQYSFATSTASKPVTLWGKEQTFTLKELEKIAYYRQQLTLVMPELFDKWQPIIGVKAQETRIKKMHTRWGTCNTRARRIWLSVYLPAYPRECTEYVIVHELCHLHHANHSRAFWQMVETAMPEYQQWHDILAGKIRQLD